MPFDRQIIVQRCYLCTGVKTSQNSFDTHRDINSAKQMIEFLLGLPTNRIVLMVVYYQANDYFRTAEPTINSVCPRATKRHTYVYRWSWSMVCSIGFVAMPWVGTIFSEELKGPAILKTPIFLLKGNF